MINVSAYKFTPLCREQLPILKEKLLTQAKRLNIKGTILLSTEGINAFFSGEKDVINSFKTFLCTISEFANLPFKDSLSEEQPFSRMLVRIKKEIISMGVDSVVPHEHTAPYISANDLKHAYESDEPPIILDTRNDYEIQLGKFHNALELDIKSFRDFPKAIQKLPDNLKSKKIVTYCTGGIRCEKAAELMQQAGFQDVHQLEGGILKYFEECGGEHYEGECFVFDKRVGVNSALEETDTKQCFACRMPLTIADQVNFPTCPHCGGNAALGKRARERQAAQNHE
tara:strand:- start:4157 stop:5008 length:852 start_codon:yes stop_codon:yes gene_type:complete